MKKKGSALILSILMLSFFMTITLTMYYIARNRNKRSIYKIKGMRISSGLDSGSAIAHYELYLADEYVSKGHPYETSGSSIDYRASEDYNEDLVTTTRQYTTEITSGSVIIIAPRKDKHYTGVVLNNYNEYFGAKWDPTITGSAITVTTDSSISNPKILNQPWIAEDKVENTSSGVISRAWLNNGGEKIVRLWTLDKNKDDPDAISVGGYRLIESGSGDITTDPDTIITTGISDKLKSVNPTKTGGITILVYEKILSIDKKFLDADDTGTEKYKITYKEKIITSGSSILTDELQSMTVEKLKEK